MISPNEFWLRLHQLSQAHDAEGPTSRERYDNIIETFSSMPPIAQREVLGELVRMISGLQDIYPEVLAVMAEAKVPTAAQKDREQKDRSA